METHTSSLICSLVTLILLLTCAESQTRPPPRRTTSPKPPATRGLVLTVMKNWHTTQDSAQIRSIPAIPYYDPWDGWVPGIKFSNPDIHFLSADVCFETKNLYLYDWHLNSIAIGIEYNPDLKLENMSFEFMHEGVSKAPIQVAYDWLSRTLYWADSGFGWIIAVPGSQARIDEDLQLILAKKDIDKPSGIAVDPHAGLLFWSDNGKTKKIERITLTGEERRTIRSRNLKSPRALEVDPWNQRLYWIDNQKEEIESVRYDGTDYQMLRRVAASSLFDIAIYQEMAVISDISEGTIYFLNTTSGKSMFSTIRLPSEITYGIAVYSEDNQPKKDQDFCAKLNCPHLCLTSPNSPNGAVCVCSQGFEYVAANNSCIEKAGSYHSAVILMTATDICLADIRSLASYRYNATCVFTTRMPTNPYPTTSTPMPPWRTRRMPTNPYPTTSTPMPPWARSSSQRTTSRPRTDTMRPRQSSTSSRPRTDTMRPRQSTASPRPRPSTTRTRPTTTLLPPEQSETILFMDVDMEERILFFASLKYIYSRSIDQRTYGNIKTGVTATNLNISGLAYDWIDRFNLFYSTTIGYIYVKNVKDTSVKRIFMRPSGVLVENLVLMPHERKLAWTSTIGSRSRIESGPIYGDDSDVTTVVDGRSAIRSLAYDQHYKTFYWIESMYVYKFTLGSNQTMPKLIHYDTEESAFHLQVFKNSLIVAGRYNSANSTNSTNTYFKTIDLTSTDTFKTVVSQGTYQNVPDVTHFKILDTELQPAEESFCKKDNGNCEQLCLTTHDGYGHMQKRCACGYGFDLQPDGFTCKSAPKSGLDFLLVCDWTHGQINEVVLDTETFHALDTRRPGKPLAVLYNRLTDRVMYSLEGDDKVYAADLSVPGSYVYLDLDFYTIPNRFALDETTGNIYFTATYFDYIGVITPQRTHIELKMDELFLADVRAIVLHPGLGFMYYSVHDYSHSYIGRASMDGTNSRKLIEKSNSTLIRWPDGLAIDYSKHHLYWADRYYDTIHRCDLNGQSCELVLEDSGADINDLQTDGIFLYYTTYGKGLFRIDLDSSYPYMKMKMGTEAETGRLGSLFLYRKTSLNQQPVSDGCKDNDGKGPCSTICLPTQYGQYTCTCDTGISLKPDGRTCTDVFQCSEFINNAQAPSTCTRYADTWCDLQCQPGYEMASSSANMTVRCSKVGWEWNTRNQLCIEIQCPLSIEHVTFNTGCLGEIEKQCSYDCAPGYTPTMRSVQCDAEGNWNIDAKDFCIETRCPIDAIINGGFKPPCVGKTNTACDYECITYYTPAYTPPRITCQSSGLWNKNATIACIAQQCRGNISNGAFIGMCDRAVGKTCAVRCNPDYVNTASDVVCTTTGSWSPANICKRKPCSKTIKNGVFVGSCSGEYNAICQFSCNSPYFESTIVASSLTCGTGGQWKNGQAIVNTDTLCKEILCTQNITNAVLARSCDRKVLSRCDFTCNSGYVKNTGVTKATCMDTGTWSTNDVSACVESCGGQFRCDNGQCIPMEKECDNITDCSDESDEGDRCVMCPETVPFGKTLACRDRSVGRSCAYMCNKGYHKVADIVICLIGGTWHIPAPCEADTCPGKFKCKNGQCIAKDKECDGTTDCTDKSDEDDHCAVTCPAKIPGGSLSDCDRKLGKRCNFTCDKGLSKMNADLICTNGGVWHISEPCQVLCPMGVHNGKISSECRTRIVGVSCDVDCNNGFELSTQTKVTCLKSGQWSLSKGLCTAVSVKPQDQTKPGGIGTGATVGIIIGVVLMLLITAAIVAFVFMYRRRLLPDRFGSSPSAKYSTSDIAIENPGYMNATINVTDDSRHESPYDNPNEFQPTGFSNGPDLHAGYVNPMYSTKMMEEPLPEQSDIAISQEDVVLTTDSWQKEQLKGPEA